MRYKDTNSWIVEHRHRLCTTFLCLVGRLGMLCCTAMFSQPSPVISIDFLPFRFLCVRTSTIMTWAWKETKYSFVQRCCLRILKCGPIPKHVGFIMDGNRRYANKKNMACSAGHAQGFLKLSEVSSYLNGQSYSLLFSGSELVQGFRSWRALCVCV